MQGIARTGKIRNLEFGNTDLAKRRWREIDRKIERERSRKIVGNFNKT